jgi:hypothetical protein
LAALGGQFWFDLRVPVLPDDILKFRRGACSQQAIVFMALLKRFGIHYGAVTFKNPGHFVAAARIDGRWLYYDPDQEPSQDGLPVAEILRGEHLAQIYPGWLGAALREAALRGDARLQLVDTFPAPRQALFERGTIWLSTFGALLLCLLLLCWKLWEQRTSAAIHPPTRFAR